jgi:hypothetical protein
MTTQEKIRKRDEIVREWANSKLKQRGFHFESFTELQDGVKLLHLAEILSSESVGRFYHNPKSTVFMAENCTILLNFLKSKGITNLRVTSQAIVDGHESSIMSVLWQMMLTWEKNNEQFSHIEEPIPSPRPLSSTSPPTTVVPSTQTVASIVSTKPCSSSQGTPVQEASTQSSLSQTSPSQNSPSPDVASSSSPGTATPLSSVSSSPPLSTPPSSTSAKTSKNLSATEPSKVSVVSGQPSKPSTTAKSLSAKPDEAKEGAKDTDKVPAQLRAKSATVSVPNSGQRENRTVIELTGDSKVLAFIQSALPNFNEGPNSVEVSSVSLAPTSPRQRPSVPPRPHRPSLALITGIDPKAPPEPPPKVISPVRDDSLSSSDSSSSERKVPLRQSSSEVIAEREPTRRMDSTPNLSKGEGDSIPLRMPNSARSPQSPRSKAKTSFRYNQNEVINENAQLRKENEMFRKMNEKLRRELERRKSFAVPADENPTMTRDAQKAKDEIQKLQNLLKMKDKEIEKLKKENELLHKELDRLSKRMRKQSLQLFPDDMSTGSGSARSGKESKVLTILNPRKWFKSDKGSPHDSQMSVDSTAEDISDESDEAEDALVTIQNFIRRYHAMRRYHQLQRLHSLSMTEGFHEALIKIQASLRSYNAWMTLQRIKSYQNYPRQIVLIQAVLRRYLAMRNYRLAKKRKFVAKELRDTEKTYNDGLQALTDVFYVPLKTNGILSQDQVRVIFSELQVITAYNKTLLMLLEQRVAKWTYESCIGDIFEKITKFLKVYTTYCNNYNRAIEMVDTLRKSNSAFKEFLIKGRQDPRCKELEFLDLLVLPIQRIPRYVMLLEDLLRCTPESHKDYELLKKSLNLMKDVANYVNERKRENENLQAVLQIQSVLINYSNLAKPARRYIDEGPLILLDPQSNKKKQLYFFLFNDLLLGAKRNKQKIAGVEVANFVASKITGTVEKMYKFVIEVPITHESKVVDAGQKIHGSFVSLHTPMTLSVCVC